MSQTAMVVLITNCVITTGLWVLLQKFYKLHEVSYVAVDDDNRTHLKNICKLQLRQQLMKGQYICQKDEETPSNAYDEIFTLYPIIL